MVSINPIAAFGSRTSFFNIQNSIFPLASAEIVTSVASKSCHHSFVVIIVTSCWAL
jgi:hypothetical protein